MEEQLSILTGMWSTPEGELYSFDGRHYKVIDSPGLPKPQQRPGPPIIVGGWGPRRTPRLAARFASEYNLPFSPVDAWAVQRDVVRAACETQARDPDDLVYSATQVLCCGRDEAEVAHRAAAIGREPGELRESGFGGTPQEVAEKMRAFRDAGASRLYLQTLDVDDHEHLELVAAEVVPLLS